MNDRLDLCCGCSACAEVCPTNSIAIKVSPDGFYKASINHSSCIECDACKSVCPLFNFHLNTTIKAYAGYCNDSEIRHISTSGGIFSAIAESIIQQNGHVFGAAFDSRLHLSHIKIDNCAGIKKLIGSKYLQSDLGGIYAKVAESLKEEIPVLFVGTPCQVAGLYNAIGREKHRQLLTIDLICHGVPSPELFHDYCAYFETKNRSKIINYNFRSKEQANDTISYTAKILLEDGRTIFSNGDEDPYALRYIGNALQNECCYKCPFAAVNRVGDITLGDYWGYQNVHPELRGIDGVSLILANTDKGKRLLTGNPAITLVETDESKYLQNNHHLLSPPEKSADRDRIYSAYKKMGFSKWFYQHYFLPRHYRTFLFKRRIRKAFFHENSRRSDIS